MDLTSNTLSSYVLFENIVKRDLYSYSIELYNLILIDGRYFVAHLSTRCEKVLVITAYNFGITKLKFLIKVAHQLMENVLANNFF